MQVAGKLQRFAPGGEGIQCRRLHRESQSPADLVRLRSNVEPGYPRDTARCVEQRGQDADRGRLPRAVRPEETEQLARLDSEGDPVDGTVVCAVHLDQVLHVDQGAHVRHTTMLGPG